MPALTSRTCGALLLLLVAPAFARADPPRLTRIALDPPAITLSGAGARQQLLVTGHYDDGSVRDLTHQARYQSSRAEAAYVDGPVVHAAGDGAAVVAARIDEHHARAKVTVRSAREA